MRRFTRRGVLQTGSTLALGAGFDERVASDGRSGRQGPHENPTSQDAVRGRVVDLYGAGVDDALVWAVDGTVTDEASNQQPRGYENDEDRQQLATARTMTETDEEGKSGWFTFPEPDLPPEPQFVAEWADADGSMWTTSYDQDPEELVLQHELLHQPELARVGTWQGPDGAYPEYGGCLTVWRTVDPADLTSQQFYVDVTQAMSGQIELPSGNIIDLGPHELSLDVQEGRDQSDGDLNYHPFFPGNAVFSLVIPERLGGEDVVVDYEGTTVLEANERMVEPSDGMVREYLTRWHPKRGPQVPAYLAPDARARYEEISGETVQDRKRQQRDMIADMDAMLGFSGGLIKGLVTGLMGGGVGFAINTTVSAIQLTRELLDDGSGAVQPPDASLGDGVDPESYPNPNVADVVERSYWWEPQIATASVVLRVSVEFPDVQTEGEFIGEAVWDSRHQNPYDEAPYTCEYSERFDAGPLVQPERASRAGETDVVGRVLEPDGSPSAGYSLVMLAEDGSVLEWVTTGEDGRFSYERPGTVHEVQYYQLQDSDPANEQLDLTGTPFPRDGVPDLFAVARLAPSDAGDLGTIQLPEAYPLEVRVVDGTGDPIEGAGIVIEHHGDEAVAGASGHTDETGVYDPWPETDQTGVEVRGETTVGVVAPGDGDEFADTEKERELDVTEPTEVTVTLERADDPDSDVVTGRIRQPDGAPAAQHTLVIYTVENSELVTMVTTDEEGAFSYEAPGARHDIQYYQMYDTDTSNKRFDPGGPRGPRDGVPDVFALAQHEGTGSLGTVELPEAYPLDVRVVDRDGDPIEGALVTIEHYNDEADAGLEEYPTNADGYFVWGGTETGIEVRGDVRVLVRPPEDSDDYEDTERERDLRVTEPVTIEVTLGRIDP